MGKVLVIVDDVSDVLVPLGKLFKAQNYDVHTFLNPLAALHFIRSTPTDVVLSDYRMPQMDGVTFARVLRNIGWTGSLFFMSGYIAELNQQELVGLGINGILEKPFNAMELMEFITRTLEEGATQAAASYDESPVLADDQPNDILFQAGDSPAQS